MPRVDAGKEESSGWGRYANHRVGRDANSVMIAKIVDGRVRLCLMTKKVMLHLDMLQIRVQL